MISRRSFVAALAALIRLSINPKPIATITTAMPTAMDDAATLNKSSVGRTISRANGSRVCPSKGVWRG